MATTAARAAAGSAEATASKCCQRACADTATACTTACDWLANPKHVLNSNVSLPTFQREFDHARRSAGPYRPDQCRDRAAAPIPRLGPRTEAASGAQRPGRGSDAV